MDVLKPVTFRAASNPHDKLTECGLRLVALIAELDSRKTELEAAQQSEGPSGLAATQVPAHNTRIFIKTRTADKGEDSESGEDDEFVSRDAMKRQVQHLVDSKSKKKRRKGGH